MNTQTNKANQINVNKLGWVQKPTKRTVWIKIFWDEYFTLYPECTVDLVMGYVGNQYYCITAELAAKHERMMEKLKFSNVTLVAGMTENGYPFWFPVYEPRNTDEDHELESIKKIVDKADEYWFKLQQKSRFDKVRTKSFNIEPKPEMLQSLQQLLKNSFPGEYFIGSENHPLLQKQSNGCEWMDDLEDD